MPDTIAGDLAARVLAGPPRLGSTRLLCIDGRSGAGKTALALDVATRLSAPVLHLDLAYRGWHGLAAGLDVVRREVLEPLHRGEPGSYRQWDWHADQLGARTLVSPTPTLVVEGVGACTAMFRRFATTTAWVEASTDARRERALARDGDTFIPHWDVWAAQEDALFAHDAVAAEVDVVIDNEERR
ncbi:4-amino-4-deoxy-L-arabinose transferase [Nocardioides alcanivorans]|uniref:4-amino-4-deoxy-L-arabinose transferase n=1 Tax=Nocardioides alcanivorans TaxID=2897352 RepID=UPI001F460994|nr:4-amino-4-deoxy-L-arabinose transferase [Nocardioides alcanivorans]